MTVCDVCGGEHFTLEDGFYFCNECHTQSQDIREMVTDSMYSSGATLVRSAAVSEKTLADRKRLREMRAEVRGVRPLLSSAEVLNLLLRRWSTALVARGAPPLLPELTAKLWEALLRYPLLAQRNKRPKSFGTNLRTAVALLWLALAECEPHCRLSDVMRWARQGVVPVYSAANELPEDVSAKWHMFSVSHIETRKMCDVLSPLVNSLRWTPPPQPPLRQLLRRLLAELALPARLADVVANVARRARPLCTYLPEANALALLLVTLKMLLGLDDATEIRNSEVAAARNEAHPDGPRWFVFTEWLQLVRQLRADAGEQDFQELDNHQRDLPTASGPDMCRRWHRQLLFDFYRREGKFRCGVEVPRKNKARYFRPEYKLQTGQLFGRPEAAAALASDADDLLWPVSSRLERDGGEALRLAELWRHSQVEFLLDESHVRSLQSEGVPVEVERAAARPRVVAEDETIHNSRNLKRDMPHDIQLVTERDEALPQAQLPLPPRHRPRRDLRLFMPCGQVWCVPPTWTEFHFTRRFEYQMTATSWPASFHVLLETLASSIELTPVHFLSYVCQAEKDVLDFHPQEDRCFVPDRRKVRKQRKSKRSSQRNRESKSTEEAEEKKRKMESPRESVSPVQGNRTTESKGMRASDESTKDEGSTEMVLGSEPEADPEADTTPYSPDLFE